MIIQQDQTILKIGRHQTEIYIVQVQRSRKFSDLLILLFNQKYLQAIPLAREMEKLSKKIAQMSESKDLKVILLMDTLLSCKILLLNKQFQVNSKQFSQKIEKQLISKVEFIYDQVINFEIIETKFKFQKQTLDDLKNQGPAGDFIQKNEFVKVRNKLLACIFLLVEIMVRLNMKDRIDKLINVIERISKQLNFYGSHFNYLSASFTLFLRAERWKQAINFSKMIFYEVQRAFVNQKQMFLILELNTLKAQYNQMSLSLFEQRVAQVLRNFRQADQSYLILLERELGKLYFLLYSFRKSIIYYHRAYLKVITDPIKQEQILMLVMVQFRLINCLNRSSDFQPENEHHVKILKEANLARQLIFEKFIVKKFVQLVEKNQDIATANQVKKAYMINPSDFRDRKVKKLDLNFDVFSRLQSDRLKSLQELQTKFTERKSQTIQELLQDNQFFQELSKDEQEQFLQMNMQLI